MIVSEAIRKIRWELRLSQRQLAEAIETAQTVVSGWENGRAYPNFRTLKKLEKFAKDNKLEMTFE